MQKRRSLMLRKKYLYDSSWLTLHKEMKFSINDFSSKCDQIRNFLRIWSHLLKKFVMENFILYAVLIGQLNPIQWAAWQKVALVLIFPPVWECCLFHIKVFMFYCSSKNRIEHFRDAESCVVWQSLSRSNIETTKIPMSISTKWTHLNNYLILLF